MKKTKPPSEPWRFRLLKGIKQEGGLDILKYRIVN